MGETARPGRQEPQAGAQANAEQHDQHHKEAEGFSQHARSTRAGPGARSLSLDNVEALLDFSRAIRRALVAQNVTGPHGEEVDHIELFGAPSAASLDSRNFVLCPGSAYDRSPCGTGTSAKLACLAADGKLAEGALWRQESIVGSVFEGSYGRAGGDKGGVVPTVTGRAFVCAEGTLLMDPADPFCWGIR